MVFAVVGMLKIPKKSAYLKKKKKSLHFKIFRPEPVAHCRLEPHYVVTNIPKCRLINSRVCIEHAIGKLRTYSAVSSKWRHSRRFHPRVLKNMRLFSTTP